MKTLISFFLCFGWMGGAQAVVAGVADPRILEATAKLTHAVSEVRQQGVMTLANVRDPEALPGLIQALRHADGLVCQYAIGGVVQLSTQAGPAMLALLEVIKGPHVFLRSAVISALGVIKDPQGLPVVLAALKDSDIDMKLSALRALGGFTDPRVFLALGEALNDREMGVRQAAIDGLAASGVPEAAVILSTLLEDPDPGWRTEAGQTMGRMGEAGVSRLTHAVVLGSVVARQAAAKALGGVRDSRAMPALIGALSDPEPWVRQEAARALGKMGRVESLDVLRAALDDPHPAVQYHARQAYRLIKEKVDKDDHADKDVTFSSSLSSLSSPSSLSNLELTWFEPRLSFEMDERVAYALEQWTTTPAGSSRRLAAPVYVTFRITDVDPWAQIYTLGPERPEEASALQRYATDVFDRLSFFLPSGPSQWFEGYFQERGRAITEPPPPQAQEPRPIQIGKKGEFVNRFQIIGEVKELVGKTIFEAKMTGWEIDEGELCVKIDGAMKTRYGDGPESVERIELLFAPRSGRVRKATMGEGSSVFRLVASFRPRAEPMDPPTAEGVTTVLPPLSKRLSEAVLAVDDARARGDEPGRVSALETARVFAAGERGVVEAGPGRYWGPSMWVQQAGRLRPSEGLAEQAQANEWVRRHVQQWDEGMRHSVNVLARETSAAPPIMRRFAQSMVVQPSSLELGESWQSTGVVTIQGGAAVTRLPSHAWLSPVGSKMWVVRAGRLIQVDRNTGFAVSLWRDHEVMASEGSASWLLRSRWADTPETPALAHWQIGEDSLQSWSIPMEVSRAPWHILSEISRGDRVYLVNSSSQGQRHVWLSAWDPIHQRWMFRDRWFGTVAVAEGGFRGLKIRSALSADRRTLIMGSSTGWLACLDAETGELRWSRTVKALPAGEEWSLAVSPEAVWFWRPGDRTLAAFDKVTGVEWGQAKVPEADTLAGVVDSWGYLVLPDAVIAVDAHGGRETWRWKWPAGERLAGRVTLAGGRVWVPTATKVYSIDVDTGRLLASWSRTDEAWCEIIVTDSPDRLVWVVTAHRLEGFRPQTVLP